MRPGRRGGKWYRSNPGSARVSQIRMPDAFHLLEETVTRDVTRALAEDVGTGDLTARLIPEGASGRARLMTRQSGVLCGVEWFRRTFEELDPDVETFWHHR